MGLTAKGLRVDYGRTRVIEGLDLAPVLPGQLLALVGPNGAGKSTLLKALAGLVPARGEVLLHGQDLAGLSGPQRAARVGYMPQALPDDLALSVLDGLLSILRATEGGGMSDPVQRSHACLQGLGIAHLALKPLSDLSGGQRQMASLAQALVRAPEVLLLDEPTSALDLRYQAQVMGAVRAYAQGPRLAVVVLHDLALAARWADRIAVLHGGRLRADGPPGAVFTPALLADVYGVQARVEACSQGGLQVLVDGVA